MLAYVFAHWPGDAAHTADYERQLLEFHQALARGGSEGFVKSVVFRVEVGYEDWYLVEGSFALDPLNEAAVSLRLRRAHDAVAHAAGGGLGSLFRLHAGVPGWDSGTVAWLSKPRGETYADFYARFAPETVIWRRQLVLGGPTEFLIEGDPPDGLTAQRVRRELLF
ncbi:MAG: hypothetical protein ABI838_03350 [Chloroflexota bacterium]